MARKGENIYKRKDGRWEGRYIKERRNGRAVYGSVFARTYLEAKRKKNDAIAHIQESAKRKDKKKCPPTLSTIGRQWLDDLRLTRKPSTIVKYENQLRKHIFPVFGNQKIDQITNDDIIAFSKSLLSGQGTADAPMSPKSVSDILSRMKSIRRYALMEGMEVQYAADCIAIPQHSQPIRVLDRKEEEVLYRYLNDHCGLTELGILLCLFTGIRLGELCALRWDDFSMDERKVHIRRTMQRLQTRDSTHKTKTYIDISAPKSACSIRTIPIPDHIFNVLQKSYAENAYLLTGSLQKFIEPRTMQNRFKKILADCHIPDANFHALRHTFATRCVEVGFDIKSLSEILGHASISITLDRYVHPTMELKQENMNRLSKLFAVK